MADKLPDEVEEHLFDCGGRGRDAVARGDLAGAERAFLSAWNALPEPKARWDRTPSMTRALVLFYRDSRQFPKADQWLGLAREFYDDSSAGVTTVDLLEATVRYTEGRLDEAFVLFDKLYQAYKERPFQGERPEYLKFYKERSGRSKGPGKRSQ